MSIFTESCTKKAEINVSSCKPILKWAGGKTQLLPELRKLIPMSYNKYIEPFLGGGALFFDHCPKSSVLSDLNCELINFYKVVRDNPYELISELKNYTNSKEFFYKLRAKDMSEMSAVEQAARTLYLNKTCFNGLYRVNRKGEFNTPYGKYNNPKICDENALYNASSALSNTQVIQASGYKNVLMEFAESGDFIFLDPPYLPVSEYSDFKRYTKEQFYEEDQVELAKEVDRLYEMGCYVVLTNSNHPLIQKLYSKYQIDIYSTKRNISCNGKKRIGQDVIVSAFPKPKPQILVPEININKQTGLFPPTRYMGAKSKLLPYIRDAISKFSCKTIYDVFSGSGVVSYMLKSEGYEVSSNDYMNMNYHISNALIENNKTRLTSKEINSLFLPSNYKLEFSVQDTFKGLYFSDEDNRLIDLIRANIKSLKSNVKKSIALSALIRACVKKRPRGIFTYIGARYNDGRKDLKLSLKDQFISAVASINNAVFDNGMKNKARCGDAMTIRSCPDLVYMDPPYYSPLSDNEYVRRYHFVEGIARDWQGVDIQWNTKTKKFKNYPTPFSTKIGAYSAFNKLFSKFKNSIIVVSYSSNSIPTLDEMVMLLGEYKRHVEIISIDYKYSFANQKNNRKNNVQEYLFIGY